MRKTLLNIAAIGALTLSPAFAQSDSAGENATVPPTGIVPVPSAGTTTGSFLQQQDRTQLRASKILGAPVHGPDDSKIGNISDILFDSSGNARAAVVGIAGEKNVAMPFTSLTLSPSASGDKVEKVTVAYRKEELEKAPVFRFAGTESK